MNVCAFVFFKKFDFEIVNCFFCMIIKDFITAVFLIPICEGNAKGSEAVDQRDECRFLRK